MKSSSAAHAAARSHFLNGIPWYGHVAVCVCVCVGGCLLLLVLPCCKHKAATHTPAQAFFFARVTLPFFWVNTRDWGRSVIWGARGLLHGKLLELSQGGPDAPSARGGVPAAPSPRRHLLSSVRWISAILVAVLWRGVVPVCVCGGVLRQTLSLSPHPPFFFKVEATHGGGGLIC